ncbi:hypothetical protein CBN_2304 [Clostridium botulinum NCTC 2916]|uniref:Uncharacterized protein n=1 Tax=Clostridium botulinum (strain Kyoto / Type A2) TaxID=536232 RepID=C1FR41_CLOBJ|nr:conserved hypothetical protein [Clostridium botulinum A2 str. Kyoto]EDT80419.1 hypothetical protein CBN_2304 [Clostridium botulinum NCTC 2916]
MYEKQVKIEAIDKKIAKKKIDFNSKFFISWRNFLTFIEY